MATKRALKGQKQRTVAEVTAYYYRNRARMRYDFYLQNGYPIASGSVEGACKNLVTEWSDQGCAGLSYGRGGVAVTRNLSVRALR
jgi:hypothetical protein